MKDSVIKINIKTRNDYISKFNDKILSKEISEYIMDECKVFPINSPIRIEVSSEYEMNDTEKESFVNMIRNNFANEINEMLFYRKRNVVMDMFIFVLGIISLVIYLFSSNIPILSEFILVFSWVLIWESSHNLIFSGFSNKIEIERKKMIRDCMIVFE